MRRWICALMALLMILLWLPALADDSFIVVDEEENLSPDPRRQARALMRDMTPKEMIYQLFMVSPESISDSDWVTKWKEGTLLENPVGGIILFGQNIVSEAQLRELTAAIQADAEKAGIYPLFIGVDEEGGAVSRVANKLGYELAPSPQAIGENGNSEEAFAAGSYLAGYLKPLGIHLAFSPVADVLLTDNEELGERAYGDDPLLVANMAAAMASGLRDGGVIPCYKHFPGHGSVSGNTHTGSASTRRTADEMLACEWIPFQSGIHQGIEMIMTSHLIARGLGDDIPASLSPVVIQQYLRNTLGYDGVVISDALRMAAITDHYKPGTAAKMAIEAGVDIILLPGSFSAAVAAVEEAVANGEISMTRIEESVERILALKIQYGLIQ